MSASMSLRGDATTRVECNSYPDRAPILSLDAYPGAHLSIYVGNRGQVDAEGVRFARALAVAAQRFLAEAERIHALGTAAAAAQPELPELPDLSVSA